MPSTPDPIRILLVEDNPGDVRLTREALLEAGVRHRLHVVHDGDDALLFLRRQGRHVGAPRPDVVLLDLNLPRRNGRQVLAEIRADPALERLSVIVVTTSSTDDDVTHPDGLRADRYVTKPVDLTEFINVMRGVEAFWRERSRRGDPRH